MPNLTSRRSSGIKTGYWSPAKKDDLVQRLGPIEEQAKSLIADACDHYCMYRKSVTTFDRLPEHCSQCPMWRLHNLIYPR